MARARSAGVRGCGAREARAALVAAMVAAAALCASAVPLALNVETPGQATSGVTTSYTFTTSAAGLRVLVQPCSGAVSWQLLRVSNNTVIASFEQPGDVDRAALPLSGAPSLAASTPLPTTTAQFLAPEAAAGAYDLRVTAVRAADFLVYATNNVSAFPYPAVAQQDIAIPSRTTASVALSWAPAALGSGPGPLRYCVEWYESARHNASTLNGSPCAAALRVSTRVCNLSATEFNVTGLAAGTLYRFEVAAVDGAFSTGYRAIEAATASPWPRATIVTGEQLPRGASRVFVTQRAVAAAWRFLASPCTGAISWALFRDGALVASHVPESISAPPADVSACAACRPHRGGRSDTREVTRDVTVDAAAGRYELVVRAEVAPTSAFQLYAEDAAVVAASPDAWPFVALPADPFVAVEQVAATAVTLRWAAVDVRADREYCVHFVTAADDSPLLVHNAGCSAHFDNAARRVCLSPAAANAPTTWRAMRVEGLAAGTEYLFDVSVRRAAPAEPFAVAYRGVRLFTAAPLPTCNAPVPLSLPLAFVSRTFTFSVAATATQLGALAPAWSVRAAMAFGQPTRAQLARGAKVVAATQPNADGDADAAAAAYTDRWGRAGNYTLTLQALRQPAAIELLVANALSGWSAPEPPISTGLLLTERALSELSLAWAPSQSTNVSYCAQAQRVADQTPIDVHGVAASPALRANDSRTVTRVCGLSEPRATLTGLSPNTAYVIDVVAQRAGGGEWAYQPLRVSTAAALLNVSSPAPVAVSLAPGARVAYRYSATNASAVGAVLLSVTPCTGAANVEVRQFAEGAVRVPATIFSSSAACAAWARASDAPRNLSFISGFDGSRLLQPAGGESGLTDVTSASFLHSAGNTTGPFEVVLSACPGATSTASLQLTLTANAAQSLAQRSLFGLAPFVSARSVSALTLTAPTLGVGVTYCLHLLPVAPVAWATPCAAALADNATRSFCGQAGPDLAAMGLPAGTAFRALVTATLTATGEQRALLPTLTVATLSEAPADIDANEPQLYARVFNLTEAAPFATLRLNITRIFPAAARPIALRVVPLAGRARCRVQLVGSATVRSGAANCSASLGNTLPSSECVSGLISVPGCELRNAAAGLYDMSAELGEGAWALVSLQAVVDEAPRTTLPPAPAQSALSLLERTASSLRVFWQPQAGFNASAEDFCVAIAPLRADAPTRCGYELSRESGAELTCGLDQLQTDRTFSDLAPATAYVVNVAARRLDTGATRNWASLIAVTADAASLVGDAPRTLTVAAGGTRVLTLAPTADADAAVNVEVQSGCGLRWSVVGDRLDPLANSTLVSPPNDLRGGGVYRLFPVLSTTVRFELCLLAPRDTAVALTVTLAANVSSSALPSPLVAAVTLLARSASSLTVAWPPAATGGPVSEYCVTVTQLATADSLGECAATGARACVSNETFNFTATRLLSGRLYRVDVEARGAGGLWSRRAPLRARTLTQDELTLGARVQLALGTALPEDDGDAALLSFSHAAQTRVLRVRRLLCPVRVTTNCAAQNVTLLPPQLAPVGESLDPGRPAPSFSPTRNETAETVLAAPSADTAEPCVVEIAPLSRADCPRALVEVQLTPPSMADQAPVLAQRAAILALFVTDSALDVSWQPPLSSGNSTVSYCVHVTRAAKGLLPAPAASAATLAQLSAASEEFCGLTAPGVRVEGLEAGASYDVDVAAVRNDTGVASWYRGLDRVTTALVLQPDVEVPVALARDEMQLTLVQRTARQFALLSCYGAIDSAAFINGTRFLVALFPTLRLPVGENGDQQSLSQVITITVPALTGAPGDMWVTLRGARDVSSEAVMLLSSSLATFNFPLVPSDGPLRVVARTNTSLEVQWGASLSPGASYCLFVHPTRELDPAWALSSYCGLTHRLFRPQFSLCPSPTTQVLVSDLQPATSYSVAAYVFSSVSRRGTAYPSLTASTFSSPALLVGATPANGSVVDVRTPELCLLFNKPMRVAPRGFVALLDARGSRRVFVNLAQPQQPHPVRANGSTVCLALPAAALGQAASSFSLVASPAAFVVDDLASTPAAAASQFNSSDFYVVRTGNLSDADRELASDAVLSAVEVRAAQINNAFRAQFCTDVTFALMVPPSRCRIVDVRTSNITGQVRVLFLLLPEPSDPNAKSPFVLVSDLRALLAANASALAELPLGSQLVDGSLEANAAPPPPPPAEDFSGALVAGIAAGVIIVLAAIVVFALIKWRKRRAAQGGDAAAAGGRGKGKGKGKGVPRAGSAKRLAKSASSSSAAPLTRAASETSAAAPTTPRANSRAALAAAAPAAAAAAASTPRSARRVELTSVESGGDEGGATDDGETRPADEPRRPMPRAASSRQPTGRNGALPRSLSTTNKNVTFADQV